MQDVIAILCSDVHFSHQAPAARAAEPDWYRAMRRPFIEIKSLVDEHRNCPLVIAGDIFDRWNSPAELINFVIDLLGDFNVYAIPGQHDLPNHSSEEIARSAYTTLTRAKVIQHIYHTLRVRHELMLHAFHWNSVLCANTKREKVCTHLAVGHKYIWNAANSFPGAPEDGHVSKVREALQGFDAAVFGDNHKGFYTPLGNIFNAGTLLRRKNDERNYKPQVGLLHPDGTITPHYLDCSEDKWVEVDDLPIIEQTESGEMKAFLEELVGLSADSLDFRQAVNHAMDAKGVSDGVRARILRAIG